MIKMWQLVDIWEGYVLTYDELEDTEGFMKYSYEATDPDGNDVFEKRLRDFTYQANHAFVIDEFRNLIRMRNK